MTLARGEHVGPYEVLGPLGAGGMGEVFRARDSRLGREVALKVIGGASTEPDRVRRFEQEARAAGALNHPNVLTVFDVGTHAGAPFLITELLEGQTLRERLTAGPLPVRKALELAAQIAHGLAAAHEKHIVHRDLKPANLFLTTDGRIKILDFGLAKLMAADAPAPGGTLSEGTGAGAVLGSVGYMAPEQVRGEPADERSDVFSLGAVLYELLSGKRAFPGSTAVEVGYATLTREPAELPAEVPPGAARLVRRCLEKSPAERFQSARDVGFSLEAVADSPGGPTALLSGQPERRRPRAVLLFGVLIGLVAAFAVGQWTRTRSSAAASPTNSTRKLTRLTSEAGMEWGPRISPDGTWFVFGAKTKGVMHLFRQRVGGTTRTDLTPNSTRDDSQPAISPDGERIAFRSDRDTGGTYVMGATGESVRRVTDIGYHPAWSPDGKRLLVSTTPVTSPAWISNRAEAWVVDVESGEKHHLETGPHAFQGAWSPHDRRLAFCGVTPQVRQLFTVPTDGGTPKVLVDVGNERMIWNPIWSSDGRYLYFSTRDRGAFQIGRVEVDEATGERKGEPQNVTSSVGNALYFPSVSSDGTKLVFSSYSVSSNIERASLNERGEIVGSPSAVTRGNASSFSMSDPSPDGEHLVFCSGVVSAELTENIYIARADGSDLRALTTDVARLNRAPRWTSDAKSVVFASNHSGTWSPWAISPDGSGLRKLGDFQGATTMPLPSRTDGRAVVKAWEGGFFVFETGLAVAGRTSRPVVQGGPEKFGPWDWSPDDKLLAGNISDSMALFSLDAHSYEPLTADGSSPRWFPDGKHLVFVDPDGLGLSRYDLEHKEATRLLSASPDSVDSPVVSRDGHWLYFERILEDGDVWMMDL